MLYVKVLKSFFWFEIPTIEALHKGPPKPHYATAVISHIQPNRGRMIRCIFYLRPTIFSSSAVCGFS